VVDPDTDAGGTGARALAEAAHDATAADAGERTLTRARHLVLDSLGVTVGATALGRGERMVEFWAAAGGRGDATVPGAPARLPVLAAGYANGYLANLLDYDDTWSGRAVGHPGATVVPPAVAAAEYADATGADLLDAVLAGYEVSVRVGEAIMPTPERARTVVSTATWGVFGATAAAARLLGLDPDRTAHALALAAVSAPVPAVRKVGIEDGAIHDLKNNYGWASMGGLKAALLADAGFDGNPTVFDGERGFWRMAGSDAHEPSVLRNGPDRHPIRGVSFKPYPSCRWSHAALDCATALEPVAVDEVRRIVVETFREAATLDGRPDSVVDAGFSLPHVLAVHLLGHPPGPRWLDADRRDDPSVVALADRVRLRADPEMTADYEADGTMRARVTVERADGSERTAAVDAPSGGPERPLGYDAVREKFDRLVAPVLGDERTRRLRERVLALGPADDGPAAGVARPFGPDRTGAG
jgi:2-methylcitrate dehydratase PrpD